MENNKYNNPENKSHKDRMMPVSGGDESDKMNMEKENQEMKGQSSKQIPDIKEAKEDFNSSSDKDINMGADSRSSDEEDKARKEGPYGMNEPGYGSRTENKPEQDQGR